eukprot:Selendium_serpulae@DN3186_c0_g1_i2.p1
MGGYAGGFDRDAHRGVYGSPYIHAHAYPPPHIHAHAYPPPHIHAHAYAPHIHAHAYAPHITYPPHIHAHAYPTNIRVRSPRSSASCPYLHAHGYAPHVDTTSLVPHPHALYDYIMSNYGSDHSLGYHSTEGRRENRASQSPFAQQQISDPSVVKKGSRRRARPQ